MSRMSPRNQSGIRRQPQGFGGHSYQDETRMPGFSGGRKIQRAAFAQPWTLSAPF